MLSPAAVSGAVATIDPAFLRTPRIVADVLGCELGCELVLKDETANPIRSFKGRGAECFVGGLVERTPLVCASAGNFGQGLAWASNRRGIELEVFAAEGANALKVARMRELGASVRLGGADFDAAKEAAREHARAHGRRFVEDGREPEIAVGAGTIALELLAEAEPLDAVLVPLGNGALLAGMATWIRHASPATEVIGVCAGGAPAMERSWRAGAVVTTSAVDTVADGIAVRVPVPEALAMLRGRVDDVVLVDDELTLDALRALRRTLGLVVEPAGAIGVAAVAADRRRFAGKRVATVLCGGNVTAAQAEAWGSRLDRVGRRRAVSGEREELRARCR